MLLFRRAGKRLTGEEDIKARIGAAVPYGGAVCLLGAGFSTLARDQDGNAVPGSGQLVSEIKQALAIDPAEDTSLTDIADFCQDDPARQLLLRRLLLKRLTLCEPSSEQIRIVSQNWRSIFTTNFDDVIERAKPNTFRIVTPTSDPNISGQDRTPLYYLHGRALDLYETDSDPKLVISERNYLALRDENRNLYARLKNELFCAKLVVLVGYSLRDLEIARIVLDPEQAFRSKTIIICSAAETALSRARLEKFGSVLPIGLTGLDEYFSKMPSHEGHDGTRVFQFLKEVRSTEPAPLIEGDDFVKIIVTGRFDRSKYQLQELGTHPTDYYCVRRAAAIATITHRSVSGAGRFIVTADFGNGKTIFIEELTVSLLSSGFRVVQIDSRLEEIFGEVESALRQKGDLAFLIDDVIRYRDVAEFIGARLRAGDVLVCTTRSDPGDLVFRELERSLGGAYRLVDLNRLSAEELLAWDRALERWGLWGQKLALSQDERLKFLHENCGAENRSIVLSLFRESRIATKIDAIVSFFVRQNRYERIFAALLISSLCQQHVSWESLVSWLSLDEHELRQKLAESEVSDFFVSGRDWNLFTSSQLAEYILRTKYVEADRDVLVEVFSTVVLRTAESANDTRLGIDFRENLKELMKFRFLTRLFGDSDTSLRLINTVYKRLSAAPRIRNNPQFWLQYAMSRMEVDDLESAETYLNTALGLAKERGADYSPFQINDQRVRLRLRKNLRRDDWFSVNEVRGAIKDLGDLLASDHSEVTYLYRSVPLILSFLEMHIDNCDKSLRDEILRTLEDLKEIGARYDRLPRSQKGETKVLFRAMDDALRILRFS
jgi:hypothetical protein